MEVSFKNLLETLNKLKSFILISYADDFKWIHFYLSDEQSLFIINSQINDLKSQYQCELFAFEDKSFQLQLNDDNLENLIIVLEKKLRSMIQFNGDIKKATDEELGIPDLSLVTIKQMTNELKNRQNLIFALVWVENNEKDNISVEGSGQPNQLIGILSRATHIAINWADQNIKFKKSEE